MMNENAETQLSTPQEARLYVKYREQLAPELMKSLGITNRLAVPRLKAVVLNMGLGIARDDEKVLAKAAEALSVVSGQKPVITRARKSVAGFKLRAGMPVGCKVTLRRGRMYEFVDRLVNIVLPRIRDFRGLSPSSFDGTGNYSLGLQEHTVFPEVDPDRFDTTFGMDITVCTTAVTDAEARELLELCGFPFRK